MEAILERDASCISLGSLEQLVQRLDEGHAMSSLHVIAGRLHAAVGGQLEMEHWIAELRDRIGADAAVVFDCNVDEPQPPGTFFDPMEAAAWGPALEAVKRALRFKAAGDAVIYSAPFNDPAGSGQRVSAAAVLAPDARVLGLAVVRNADVVNEERTLLQQLCALTWHLRCASAATAQVHALLQRPSPANLVDLLPLPCVLTDSAARCLERNESFAMFMEATGMRFTTGRLHFDDPYLQDSWHVALTEALLTAVRQSLVMPAHNGEHWRAHLVPMQCGLDDRETTARPLILVVAERVAAAADTTLERMLEDQMRPLTPAEGEVLGALLQGHPAKVIARARGASVNTVRSQIMTILEKTGHHNQKSLIAAFAPSSLRSSVHSVVPSGVPQSSRIPG